MNVNFRDKCFMIAKLFRDYCHTTVPAWTVHVVALPIILTRGIGLEVYLKRNESKETRNNDDPFLIPVLRQRLSIILDTLHRRDTGD